MGHAPYVINELRRRRGRTITTAVGLAAGVGMVMGIVGVSDGLDRAQRSVLSPLSAVGTDILVTRTVGVTNSTGAGATPTPSPTAAAGSGRQRGGGFFGGGGGGPGGPGGGGPGATALNDSDSAALLNENKTVVTDLAKLGKPGTAFTRDFFLSGTLLSFPQAAVDTIKTVPGVSSVTDGLTLLAQHETGTVPRIVASVKTGGETLTATSRPAPLTNAERTALRSCVQSHGGFGGDPGGPPDRGTPPSPGTGTRRGGGGFGGFGAFESCLPARYQQYQANVIAPLRTIQQIVNPPTTDTASASYTVAGVDPASPTAGLVTRAQVTAGTWFTNSGTDQVLAAAAYATKQQLTAGKNVTINGHTYRVVGIVNPTLTGSTADLYFPLATVQTLAGKTGRINQVLVKAKDSGSVDAVAARIRTLLPGAQVVTTKDLAGQVTGSLKNAKALAGTLGTSLAVIVLIGAFLIAALLTSSSVAKRVRDIGTLRAVGWSRGRVVRQLLAENAIIGVLGGVLGVAVGYLVAAVIGAAGPSLTAASTGTAVASAADGFFGKTAPAAVSRTLHLTAPIGLRTVLLGVVCAVIGGLLAGMFGAWRASRLQPAVALRDLG